MTVERLIVNRAYTTEKKSNTNPIFKLGPATTDPHPPTAFALAHRGEHPR